MTHKIDWTTFGASKVWTGSVNLTTSYQNITTMDISNIPTGAVVAIEAVFQYSGDANASGTTGNVVYNGSSLVTTYMVTTWARSNVALITFTKVAGADTLTFRALHDNSSASNYCTAVSAVVWRIG